MAAPAPSAGIDDATAPAAEKPDNSTWVAEQNRASAKIRQEQQSGGGAPAEKPEEAPKPADPPPASAEPPPAPAP